MAEQDESALKEWGYFFLFLVVAPILLIYLTIKKQGEIIYDIFTGNS